MLNGILGPNCSSDVCGKIMSGWVESLNQSPACRMDTSEMQATKAAGPAAPWSIPGDICIFATPKIFPTKKKLF